ncbi:MAG: hypothetical protein AUJ92_18935 [Armatimonadetes bacterium CG2_30_59_28]|nr:UbiA family prenyltransferase [Armatimonadota bacterium]OIO90386.1 MAG: hypothetical protein AUJ92_18935 [Armatimonadetes bacterium CG2_30_59_28]PIU66351.1 MAG: 4-hydroxybenzoate octaprenyltransferase [Armatimonadetes bacterium CG07_land_8_20_14_0_80_59_28]PIY47063.1 MAG: 4-hydroxybenzoate octaprenyltransferase [Armatimonadetes bacterium CG_4_10_14_3_um_filter_59_10]
MFTKIRTYFEMIKFQHTVFALPFALTAAIVADHGIPEIRVLGWILVAMFGARSAAMGFNRIVDRHIDALNPRTRERELPTGRISLPTAAVLTLVCAGLFVFAAHQLNSLAFLLSFPTLFVLCLYSYTKRFTSYSHFVLGLCLGIAPVGAWVAVRGEVSYVPALLGLGVLLWVAGFDIIYATMDDEFDRSVGLHSIVQKLGVTGGLNLAKRLHILFTLTLAAFGIVAGLGFPFFLGTGIVALLLFLEHALVRADDLTRVNVAFFNVNGIVSGLVFVATALDLLISR